MYELRELTPALAKKAAEELNETPENIEHKLKALREWALAQKHIRSRTNDQFLIVFLRGSKYSLERAKKKLENFYIYKMKMPELFYNRDSIASKIEAVVKSGCLSHLPLPENSDGPCVAMIRPNRFDLSKYTVEEVFKVSSLVVDILLLEDDNAIVAGYIILFDLTSLPKPVLYSFNPYFVRKLILLVNKISPSRMKGFHILNVPSIFNKCFNMVKNVINEKLRDRIHVHVGNMETLYKYVPREILPTDFGGNSNQSEIQNKWLKKIEEYQEYLREEENYGLIGDIEKYKNHQNSNITNDFGIEGSFRQLNFD